MIDKHAFPHRMEGLFVEFNFRKCKWLLFGACHPPSQVDIYHFDDIDKVFGTLVVKNFYLKENLTWTHLSLV